MTFNRGRQVPMTFRSALVSLWLSLCLGATMATAGELRGVVELFTSQGCASCPPADAELARLIAEDEVLALAYHVDYWNYLGWEDTLSNSENTGRQRGYAATWGRRSVYTPQAVVNGRDHANGADRRAIHRLIETFDKHGRGLMVDLAVRDEGDALQVAIGAGAGKADVVVVYFDDSSTVRIERGENAGRTITYRHSVRDIETIGMWSGEAMSIELPKTVLRKVPGRGCAVLLQRMSAQGTPAEIIGAAVFEPATEG